MPKLQPSLAFRLSVAIASSLVAVGVMLGSAVDVQACPFTDGFAGPSNAIRQANSGSGLSIGIRPTNDSKPSSGYAEFAGFGAVVGLFAIALHSKACRSRDAIASEPEVSLHPQFEHPELMLISIPKEALPLSLATEVG
jgi:hypothetical protein